MKPIDDEHVSYIVYEPTSGSIIRNAKVSLFNFPRDTQTSNLFAILAHASEFPADTKPGNRLHDIG